MSNSKEIMRLLFFSASHTSLRWIDMFLLSLPSASCRLSQLTVCFSKLLLIAMNRSPFESFLYSNIFRAKKQGGFSNFVGIFSCTIGRKKQRTKFRLHHASKLTYRHSGRGETTIWIQLRCTKNRNSGYCIGINRYRQRAQRDYNMDTVETTKS